MLPPDEQLASLPYLHASPGTDEVEGEGAATIKTADGRDVLRDRAPREALFESTSMEQVPMVSGELTNCVCRVKQISILHRVRVRALFSVGYVLRFQLRFAGGGSLGRSTPKDVLEW